MPNLGFGEILLILVVALIVFGPRRLPEMGRTVGRSLREFRRAASDLRAEIETDMDVEESPRRSARSVRARAAATGGAAMAEEEGPGEDQDDAPGDSPTEEPLSPAPDEAPTSEADRKTSTGEPGPD
jgi:sec-independent protein translocase protein TatA